MCSAKMRPSLFLVGFPSTAHAVATGCMPCLNKEVVPNCLGYPSSWRSSQDDGMNQKITMFNVPAFFFSNSFSLSVASSANRKSPLTVELLFSHYFWLWHGWSLSEITLCSSIMPPVILRIWGGKKGGGQFCTGRQSDRLTLLPSVHINISTVIIIMYLSLITHFPIKTTLLNAIRSLTTYRFLNSIHFISSINLVISPNSVVNAIDTIWGCSAFNVIASAHQRSLLPPYSPRGLKLPPVRVVYRMCQQLVPHVF